MIDLDRTPVVVTADDQPERVRKITYALTDEPWDLRVTSSEDSLLGIVNGHVPGVVLVAHDLGPRGGADICRRSRERQGLLDQAALGIGYARVSDGRVVSGSPRLCERLGSTLDGMLQLSVPQISDPVFCDDSIHEIDTLVSGAPRRLVDDLKVKWHWEPSCLVTNGLAMTDSEDRVVGYRGVSQDVTEMRRAHALLRQSEQRLKLTTQGARIGIWDWDVEGDRMIWDGQMCRLHGTRPDTSITTSEIMPSTIGLDDRDRVRNAIRAVRSDNAALDVDCRPETADGSPKHVHRIWLRRRRRNSEARGRSGWNPSGR